jgi:predicted secreted protein
VTFAVALVVVVLALGSLEYYTYETMNSQLSNRNSQIAGLQNTINSMRSVVSNDKAANGSMNVAVNQNSSIALENGAWDGGYLWQVTNVSNPNVVESVSNYTYVPPHNATLVGGPADTQIFTFKALKEGNATVTLELMRPWQMNESISRYVLDVVVGP